MNEFILNQIVPNSISEISKHANNYFGSVDDMLLLKEKFNSEDEILYTFDSVNYTFLNVPCNIGACFIIDKSGNYLFCVAATPLNNHLCSDYFPLMKPAKTIVVQTVEVAMESLKIENSNWLYVFFSSEEATIQNNLFNLITKNTSVASAYATFKSLVPSSVSSNNSLEVICNCEKIFVDENHEQVPWKGGLYFTGSVTGWPFNSMSNSGLLDFAESLPTFKTTGSVYFEDSTAFLNFQLILGTKNFSVGPLKQVLFNAIFIEPIINDGEGASYGLSGKLGFSSGNSNTNYELDITATWPDKDDDLIDFKSLVKITDIPFFDHTSIPGLEGYSTELDIGLNLKLSKADKRIEAIDFLLELDNWVIIPGKLDLKQLKFNMIILDPINDRLLIASVSAKAVLGSDGIVLNCGGSYPEGQFYFSLDPSTPIQLHQLVASFFGNHGGLREGLAITNLEGQFNYATKEFYFSVAIGSESPWEIAFGLTITELSLSIGGIGSYKGSIGGKLAIGKVNFEVNATIGDGWSFDASFNASKITLDSLFKDLKYNIPSLPDFLEKLKIDLVSLSFKSPPPLKESGKPDTKSKIEKHFKLSGSAEVNSTPVSVELKLDVDTKENFSLSGHIIVNDVYVFDIVQNKNKDTKIFLAAYHQEKDAGKIDIAKILSGLGVPSPPNMQVQLKDAFFVNDNNNTDHFNLLVADLGASMNLSNLPLVGKVLPADASVAIALRILYASDKYKWGVNDINAILPEGIAKIEEPDDVGAKGLDLIVELKIGAQKILLQLPISIGDSGTGNNKEVDPNNPPLKPTYAAAVPVNEGITWFKIGKTFGPVIFNRIGLSYSNGILSVYPDAALSMGGLTFTLNGLSVSSPITEFKPTFDLKGLGLDFKKGPLEIGASFLRKQIEVTDEYGNKEKIDEYVGMAIISTEKLSISALGSYCYYQGHHSLFIYAYLNQALGGPSFFFVEGLAAAFGYNRSLIMPTIDQVSTFPLVRQVMETQMPDASKSPADLLSEQLEAVSKFIPPSPGQMFVAIGIRFNSFKLIDSFVLLAISFGRHTEIDVLGQSNIVVPSVIPPGTPPLAEIKIQLMAKYLPDEGSLEVRAQLTADSYILSKDCHLSGGAAFYSWFKGDHEGDFVMTMGGYHPSFNVPSHYPQVPRLALNWQVSSALSIKGDMYFALCPHAFMAGGHLEALYTDGPLIAWFKAGADFLVTWQPYHYEASMYLDIGASYTYHLFGTHHITVDVGADVQIWGPAFAGTATVHIWIIDITVAFGPQEKPALAPLSWTEFQKNCLPAPEKIISVAITQGKHNENGNKVAIVNPKELCIVVNSAVPIRDFTAPKSNTESNLIGNNEFGVSPMNISSNILSTQTIEIKKDGRTLINTENLIFNSVAKKVPSAIWGTTFSPALNAKDKTIELVTGLTITTSEPKELPDGGISFVSAGKLLDFTHAAIPCIDTIPGIDFSLTDDIIEINKFRKSNVDFDKLCNELEFDGISLIAKN